MALEEKKTQNDNNDFIGYGNNGSDGKAWENRDNKSGGNGGGVNISYLGVTYAAVSYTHLRAHET